MIIVTFLEFFTFLISLMLGMYVLFKAKIGWSVFSFEVVTASMAFWNLSIFLVLVGIGNVDILGRLAFSFGFLFLLGFILFLYFYPVKVRKYYKLSIVTFFLGSFFIILPLIPQYVSNVTVVAGHLEGDFNKTLSTLWAIGFLLFFLYAFVLLLVRIKFLKGVYKKLTIQLFYGFSLSISLILFSNVVLPRLFGITQFNSFGPIFTIILVFFLANAVLNYRLLDIKWIIGKSVIFSVLIGFFIWIVFSVTLLLSNLVGETTALVVSALLIVVVYKPLEFGLKWVVKKIISHGGYDPKEATSELFKIVREEADLGIILEKLLDKLSGYFITEDMFFVVLKPKKKSVLLSKQQGDQLKISSKVSSFVKIAEKHKRQIVEKNELIWREENVKTTSLIRKHIALFEKTGVEAIVPFVVNHHIIGLLIFGKRTYDSAFRSQDIEFLNLIGSALAPALQNASKYEEIKNLYLQLTELDKAKSDFINIVSHRFRTPLSAIRWNLEMIIDVFHKRIGKEVTNSLKDTHDRTMFLIETLDRLFDSLAIQNGKMKLEYSKSNPKKFLSSIVELTAKNAEVKSVDFNYKISNTVVEVDPIRLSGVVRSLLANAIQYTPKNGIIDLMVYSKGDELIIEVQDTGIGISRKDIKKIFEKFYRAKNAILTHTDGQGLGMFFSKQIVLLHKGRIEVESELNRGTKFVVHIPKKKGEKIKKKS